MFAVARARFDSILATQAGLVVLVLVIPQVVVFILVVKVFLFVFALVINVFFFPIVHRLLFGFVDARVGQTAAFGLQFDGRGAAVPIFEEDAVLIVATNSWHTFSLSGCLGQLCGFSWVER